jgi:ubiquinone/menaquinone biosynthesis C-methylase UbiE
MLALIRDCMLEKTPAAILDVGCGTGRLLRASALCFPGAHLSGIDASEKMVEQAKRFTPGASIEVATAESIPVPDASIELALTSLSFHHWTDGNRGILEIFRVLQPGGFLCFADQVVPRRFASLVNSRSESKKKIMRMMLETGFSIERRKVMFGGFIFIIVVKKQ